MQVDTKDFLDLVEQTHKIAFWDSESVGREGDYGSIIVISVKPYGQKPVSFRIQQLGNDKRVVREAKEFLETFPIWCTFFGKGHDVKLVNTRLLRWGYEPLVPKLHLDMYFCLKPKLATGRKSQAHLLEFLHETMTQFGIKPESKMTVSPSTWADLGFSFEQNMKILIERCESDAAGLEALYRTTRSFIRDVTR